MSEAYGKVVTMFLVSVLLFAIPFVFLTQRQENLNQMYVMTKTVYLVDSVRNTGSFSRNMYETFQRELYDLPENYEIELMHTTREYQKTDQGYELGDVHYYKEDILNKLYDKGVYDFLREDFFKIIVYSKKKSIGSRVLTLLGFGENQEKQAVVYYGGSIKSERI